MAKYVLAAVLLVALVAAVIWIAARPDDDAEAYYNRGVAHQDEEQHDLAIKDFAKAIELKPDYADAFCNRGFAYGGKGLWDLAIKDFTKVIELAPEAPTIYENRARTYLAQKSYDAAWADVKAAQRLGHKVDPDFLADLRSASGREK